jgi:hypothetical protein
MRQIVYNAIKCLECGETIVSYSRHDYNTCGCPNGAMVDGGNEYERYGAIDMEKIETKYIYADDPLEIVRKYAVRGSRGLDGRQPLTYIPICDIKDDYLWAILEYGGPEWHLDLIRKEIKYREDGRSNKV